MTVFDHKWTISGIDWRMWVNMGVIQQVSGCMCSNIHKSMMWQVNATDHSHLDGWGVEIHPSLMWQYVQACPRPKIEVSVLECYIEAGCTLGSLYAQKVVVRKTHWVFPRISIWINFSSVAEFFVPLVTKLQSFGAPGLTWSLKIEHAYHVSQPHIIYSHGHDVCNKAWSSVSNDFFLTLALHQS